MRVAIMQPYFLPYIGYFQLIKSADIFVLADQYQYTKKGWINRNRAILNKRVETFTLAVSSDGDCISEKKLHSGEDSKSLFRKIKQAYVDAPNSQTINVRLEEFLLSEEEYLFPLIENSIFSICEFLAIDTQILRLSALDNNKELKGIDRVQDIVKNLGGDTYLNPEGGREIYAKDLFNCNGLELEFLEHNPKPYRQLIPGFVDRLSIIDLLYMHDKKDDLQVHLDSYQIIRPLE
jgi:hypothetical protein